MVVLCSLTIRANSFSESFIFKVWFFQPFSAITSLIRRNLLLQNYKKMRKFFGLSCKSKNYLYLCTANHPKRVFAEAQMAESVDALVSNTSRFTPVPVRPRLWVRREKFERTSLFLCGWVMVCLTAEPRSLLRWRLGRLVCAIQMCSVAAQH